MSKLNPRKIPISPNLSSATISRFSSVNEPTGSLPSEKTASDSPKPKLGEDEVVRGSSRHIFDKKKWQSMSIFDQMGNIGSEVGRALNAKRNGNTKNMEGAFYRGLDLIDATTENLVQQRSPRIKEVLRAREVFAESVLTDNEDPTLEKYFMEFAVAARMRQFK